MDDVPLPQLQILIHRITDYFAEVRIRRNDPILWIGYQKADRNLRQHLIEPLLTFLTEQEHLRSIYVDQCPHPSKPRSQLHPLRPNSLGG